MTFTRALTASPLALFLALGLVLACPAAEARAPAAIEYAAPSQPTQFAALESAERPVQLAKAKRGALTSYGYGATSAPASGPTIDLRGAFEDVAAAPAPRVTYTPPAPEEAPQTPQRGAGLEGDGDGPLVITPPVPAGEEALLGSVDEFSAAPPPRGLYLVQIGAFAQRDNAERTSARARAAGSVLIDTIERPVGTLYRVRVGPWPSREAAEAARAQMAQLGFTDARVTTAD